MGPLNLIVKTFLVQRFIFVLSVYKLYLQTESSSRRLCHPPRSSARPGAFKSHIQGVASGEHADRESAFHPQSVYNMPKGMVQEDSSWHQQAV